MCRNLFLGFLFENRFSSKYVCVSWNKNHKKWQVSISRKGQRYYVGYFESEEDAAKAVNLKCQELNIPLKNPSVGVLDNEILKKLKKKVNNFLL